MSNKDDIIRRLEALLRLKTERGATQAEMETAMAMAQKLAFKHRINLDEIVPDDQGQTKATDFGANMFKRTIKTLAPDCHKHICVLLTKYFGVYTIRELNNDSILNMVGTEMDLDFAIYVYAFLRVTFYKLWVEYRIEIQETETKPKIGKDVQLSFYHGLFNGLDKSLSQAKVDQEHELQKGVHERAIVLVDEHKAALAKKAKEFFPNMVMKTNNFAARDAKAYGAGQESGLSLKINKAIGGANARL